MGDIQTTSTLDYHKPGYVSEALALWADYKEIPLEEPAAEEEAAVDRILGAVLEALEARPTGWRRLIYSRWMVHCLLRQNSGNEARAAKLAGAQLAYHCEMVERAKAYETSVPEEAKRLFLRGLATYFYGVDRRANVGVLNWRSRLNDNYRVAQQIGPESYHLCHDYWNVWFMNCRYREALQNGRHSRIVCVVDSGGHDFGSMRRLWLSVATMAKWTKAFPGGQGPIDGVRMTLVRNFPSVLRLLLRVIEALLPAGTFNRVQIFSPRQDEAFLQTLFELVSPSQVPCSMGGEAFQPFALDGGYDRPLY